MSTDDLRSQLVLRANHLPSCGEGAEFPWDCTCDYGGFMDRMGVVFAAVEAARAFMGDDYTWDHRERGDPGPALNAALAELSR